MIEKETLGTIVENITNPDETKQLSLDEEQSVEIKIRKRK